MCLQVAWYENGCVRMGPSQPCDPAIPLFLPDDGSKHVVTRTVPGAYKLEVGERTALCFAIEIGI